MPKETFFNLTENKKSKLIEAAEQEFARAPLHEASIANIIKTAGIPRGSFYQYFSDKEDLYFFLLDSKLQTSKKNFIEALEKHHGDIFEAFIEIYNDFLITMPDEEEHNFIKNALLFATYRVENTFADIFDSTSDREHFNRLMELIDHKPFKDKEEVISILQMIGAIAFHNSIVKLTNKLSDEVAIKQFRIQMDFIKYGVYTEKSK
ncbi:hypothetical protein Pryu01_02449 [Paraliobacillus ryukyuensis]|uniref:TetR family transcriptional regulator n=1 Tax=Paraliobacillus ryukyuensis TaxID=200904 RepID=A0A366DWB9_9BACI|nr:TetR/AcrR family transcriptional regulator [Paraliobacillus ryukyuensis]RBO93564.1 TetR family transcriptional regulator [Paraliobacillus ryukyuensis]